MYISEMWRRRLSRLRKAVSRLFCPQGVDKAQQKNPAAIQPYYEKRAPSRQTIIDIFGGSWKSVLPGGESGTKHMFEDRRMDWLAEKIAGGMQGKSVLELGPFEGYHTYQLDKLGAREIVSVEGNSINFLKCLCIKEMYGLKASFALGDIQSFLDQCNRSYDVVCASGVLYHSQDPIRFIEHATRVTDHLYIWTHYYSPRVQDLTNGQEKHFIATQNRSVQVGSREIIFHARSYLMSNYLDKLPLYWEGGQEDIAYWLSKDDLLWLIGYFGFDVVADDGGKGQVNGLPCIGLYARRSSARLA